MGYESKIYVVQEHGPYGNSDCLAYGQKIAMFDLCKMGYEIYNGKSFRQLFNQDRTCDFYADDGNTIITEDCYGDEIQKANPKEVMSWLRKFLKDDPYWRAEIFYKFLLAIEKTENNYSIYHYGY